VKRVIASSGGVSRAAFATVAGLVQDATVAKLALLGILCLGTEARAQEAASQPGPSREAVAVRSLIARQLAHFPAMEPQDVYKLLYQATMGSRHAGLDSVMAAQWLDRELRDLRAGPDEPVLDTISTDGRMVRVNLRPYLAAGGDRGALLRAFVRTAREFHGSTTALRRQLDCVERLARAGGLPLAADSLRRLSARLRAAGYPAVEHSAAYEAAYRPAYRVVLGAFLR
jgi:hypothetical protein